MSEREAETFLRQGTRTGKLATVRSDGRPHVAPIWFVLDDGIWFTSWHTSVKAKNLTRERRAAMTVDLEAVPYAFVIVEGSVTWTEDPERLLAMATRIGSRYMGPERAEEYGLRNGVRGEVLFRLRMDKIIAIDDVSG